MSHLVVLRLETLEAVLELLIDSLPKFDVQRQED